MNLRWQHMSCNFTSWEIVGSGFRSHSFHPVAVLLVHCILFSGKESKRCLKPDLRKYLNNCIISSPNYLYDVWYFREFNYSVQSLVSLKKGGGYNGGEKFHWATDHFPKKACCWIPVEQRVYNIDVLFISPWLLGCIIVYLMVQKWTANSLGCTLLM